jgi:hypothetical protein
MSREALLPRTKPVAAKTWELRALLSRTTPLTDRIPLQFPTPMLVVGCKATVIRGSYAGGGLAVPTVQDILVLLDLDEQRRFTARAQSTAAGANSQFVNLSALDTMWRDLLINATSPQPVFGATFAWWHYEQGTPRFEDAEIALSLFVQDPIPGVGE